MNRSIYNIFVGLASDYSAKSVRANNSFSILKWDTGFGTWVLSDLSGVVLDNVRNGYNGAFRRTCECIFKTSAYTLLKI